MRSVTWLVLQLDPDIYVCCFNDIEPIICIHLYVILFFLYYIYGIASC